MAFTIMNHDIWNASGRAVGAKALSLPSSSSGSKARPSPPFAAVLNTCTSFRHLEFSPGSRYPAKKYSFRSRLGPWCSTSLRWRQCSIPPCRRRDRRHGPVDDVPYLQSSVVGFVCGPFHALRPVAGAEEIPVHVDYFADFLSSSAGCVNLRGRGPLALPTGSLDRAGHVDFPVPAHRAREIEPRSLQRLAFAPLIRDNVVLLHVTPKPSSSSRRTASPADVFQAVAAASRNAVTDPINGESLEDMILQEAPELKATRARYCWKELKQDMPIDMF
nr:hypothetical protein Iba_chr03bCG15230 [Ipomoea batatas]